jgi:transposase-like protein
MLSLENAVYLADRRVKLCSPSPVCPACGTEQVQLVDWIELPVRWRCRECRHRWQTNLEMLDEL